MVCFPTDFVYNNKYPLLELIAALDLADCFQELLSEP